MTEPTDDEVNAIITGNWTPGQVATFEKAHEGLMPNPKRCKGCDSHLGITWAEQRVQYKRLLTNGYTDSEIKQAMPRCSKCITIWKKENPPIGGQGEIV